MKYISNETIAEIRSHLAESDGSTESFKEIQSDMTNLLQKNVAEYLSSQCDFFFLGRAEKEIFKTYKKHWQCFRFFFVAGYGHSQKDTTLVYGGKSYTYTNEDWNKIFNDWMGRGYRHSSTTFKELWNYLEEMND